MLDSNSATDLPADGRAPAATPAGETIRYTQDVKCFMCGFVTGKLTGNPELPRKARPFVPTDGYATPPHFRPERLRCLRCDGACFLEDVEQTLMVRLADLEKPRRGRKPKVR